MVELYEHFHFCHQCFNGKGGYTLHKHNGKEYECVHHGTKERMLEDVSRGAKAMQDALDMIDRSIYRHYERYERMEAVNG